MPYKLTFGSSVNSLKWLDISESEINVILFIEILGKSEVIEYLDISGERVAKSFCSPDHTPIEFDPSNVVSTIGGLKKSLKTLRAANCTIQNDYSLLYNLTDCENLKHLDISGNPADPADPGNPADLSRLPAGFQFGSSRETLKCLNMSNCGTIRVDIFKAVTDLKVLEALNMDRNEYEVTQEHFKLGASKNSLNMISMSSSRGSFNPSILQAISECKFLEILNLPWSKINRFELEDFDFGEARSSLRKIDMESCEISSEVLLRAVFNCENLKRLSLGGNDLSNLPENFKLGSSRCSLKVLKMDRCQLRSQNILFEITDCSSLKQLCLSENNFSEISSNFSFGSSKRSLKVLRMDRCEIKNLFTAITSCEVLEKLSVESNRFSSYNFGTSRSTLKDLDIAHNFFSGIEDLNQIFNCKRLENLDISHISLGQFEQELNPERFAKSALKELIASFCRLKMPSSLKILTGFPKLEKIDISSNYFGSFPDDFSLGVSKDTLTTTTVENCNFSNSNIIKALTDCKRLEVLVLNGNRRLKKVV